MPKHTSQTPSRCVTTLFVVALLLVFAANAQVAPPVPLWLFGANGGDGSSPFSTPVFDPAGNLYGTTQDGGANGLGTVFKLTPTSSGLWKETILYNFKGGSADGATSDATLIRDTAGNLYGTTLFGGVTTQNCSQGCGIVFKLTPTTKGEWKETVLHFFTGSAFLVSQSDGANPIAGLIRDKAGNFYGTTAGGGKGVGTVFKLSRTSTGWQETVLHNFNGDDGTAPFAPLVLDSAGNLYGTTVNGGANNLGTVFKLTHDASGNWIETILHSFLGGSDGAEPLAGLLLDNQGNVFGASGQVGNLLPCGTVFELTAANGYAETILHRFHGAFHNDGCLPSALIFDSKGNLFGTSEFGGPDNAGTIFKMIHGATGWHEAVLFSFTGENQVEFPAAPLTFGADGNLYGTTLGGISFPGGGEVFKFVP